MTEKAALLELMRYSYSDNSLTAFFQAIFDRSKAEHATSDGSVSLNHALPGLNLRSTMAEFCLTLATTSVPVALINCDGKRAMVHSIVESTRILFMQPLDRGVL